MRSKILSFILASILVGVLAGCAGNTDTGANTETNVETTAETNTAEETTVEATVDAPENVEDADKQSEVDAEAEKEKERVAALREDIAKTIENDIPGLIAEMEANGNTEGIDALNALADKYSAEYDDAEADNFKTEYDAILEAKETYDKEYAAEQERIAAEKKAAEEEAAKKEAEIPDWFDATYYANNNPDVVAAVGNSKTALYDHYKNHGKSEGRAAYAGDPNAKAQVADSGNAGGTDTGTSGTGDFPYEVYKVYGSGVDAYFYFPLLPDGSATDIEKLRECTDTVWLGLGMQALEGYGLDFGGDAGIYNGVQYSKVFVSK